MGEQQKKWCSIVRKQNRKLKQNRVVFSRMLSFSFCEMVTIDPLFRIDDEEKAYFFSQ